MAGGLDGRGRGSGDGQGLLHTASVSLRVMGQHSRALHRGDSASLVLSPHTDIRVEPLLWEAQSSESFRCCKRFLIL